jgi:hypothetical protein
MQFLDTDEPLFADRAARRPIAYPDDHKRPEGAGQGNHGSKDKQPHNYTPDKVEQQHGYRPASAEMAVASAPCRVPNPWQHRQQDGYPSEGGHSVAKRARNQSNHRDHADQAGQSPKGPGEISIGHAYSSASYS